MEKRGFSNTAQVTVFVIIAIVLIAAGGMAYYFTKNTSTTNNYFSQSNVKPGFDNIKSSIQGCVDIACSDSLELIGIQGGYYEKPDKYLDLNWAFIPYYFYDGESLVPQNSVVESQLGLDVDKNLGTCINAINSGDFSIKHTDPKTSVSIKSGEVSFSTDGSVSISKEGNTVKLELKDIPVIKKSKLYEILEIARYISDSHKENPNSICLNCIANMAGEKDLYVTSLSLNNSYCI